MVSFYSFLLFFTFVLDLVFGGAISWIMGWVEVVVIYFKRRVSRKQMPRDIESDLLPISNVFQAGLDGLIDNTDSLNKTIEELSSNTDNNIIQTNNSSSNTLKKTIGDVFEPTAIIESDTITSLTSTIDTLKESIDGMYQHLGELKTELSEIRNTIKKGRTQNTEAEALFEKKIKDVKDSIALQHRETRRRFERLEKKTNSGYFN